MKRSLLPLLLALTLPCAPALASDNISKVNGSISAEAGQTYGNLETVNGGIKVAEGAVTGRIETVNGGIRVADRARTGGISTVNGSVRVGREVIASGGVDTVNGGIFLDRGTQIDGSLETVNGSIGLVETRVALTPGRKPRVIIGPNASVNGPLQFEREVTLYVHRTARVGPVSGAVAVPFDTDTAPQD